MGFTARIRLNNVRHSHESIAYTHSLGAAPLAE
jgi:hypothetical protein